MKVLLTILLFILGVFAALALGGGLLALMAFGVGWLLNFVMHFDPFQATLISLTGIVVFGILAERMWSAITHSPPFTGNFDSDDEDDEYDDEFDDEEDDDEYDDEPLASPGIPRWRQPLKTPDFSNTKPDDRCPCGSGRKYKNCHGVKASK